MGNLLRVLLVMVTGVGAYAIGGFDTAARAANSPMNACGCYRDAVGACFCGKKTRCDCPGDCEPKGCEEKRAKEIEREIEIETRRAREIERKQHDEEAEKKRKAEAAAREEEETTSGADMAEEQSGDSAGEQTEPGAPSKKAAKAKRVKKAKNLKKAKDVKDDADRSQG